jgi:hypothetical protein
MVKDFDEGGEAMRRKIKAPQLYQELMDWVVGMGGTAPSQVDDPEGMLDAALDYELGAYSIGEKSQAKLAEAAIRLFCQITEDYE